MNLGNRNKPKIEGGMSSMTDLIFLMLIFFIIMSTMAKNTLPVDLPSGKKTSTSQTDATVEVGIDAEDQYFLDAEKSKIYAFDQLVLALEEKIKLQSNQNLKISGDKNASYEAIFKIIAVSKQRGWKPVLSYTN
ncbi:MAG: ExbD/TolR family protein [Crocinitomicaceae bacterium]